MLTASSIACQILFWLWRIELQCLNNCAKPFKMQERYRGEHVKRQTKAVIMIAQNMCREDIV